MAVPKTHTPTTSTAFNDLLVNKSGPAGALELGDTIVLNAGTTYTGQFVLPKVDVGTGWITIQSSNLSALPAADIRVNATDAANMPKIAAPGAGTPNTGVFEVALQTAVAAHHYKLIGLELKGPANNVDSWELLRLGSGNTDQTTLASVPQNFVVDRCIVRANSATQMMRRAISLNSGNTDIINCYIADIWDTLGQSAGIGGWNGTGNYNIINNYIEAAGINFIIGGAGARIPGVVPENIVFQKNHCIKDEAAWRSNTNIDVVNLFEIKFGRNYDIQGNIFEKTWHNVQDQAIIFKVDSNNISVNTADKMKSEDILFANNIVRSAPTAIILQGRDWSAGRPPELRRVTIRNNLCYDISRAVYAPGLTGVTGHFIYSNHGGEDFTIENNTCFQDVAALSMDYGGALGTLPRVNFIYRNNVVRGNMQHNPDAHVNGVTPSTQGTAALDTFTPDAIFKKNVINGLTSTVVNNATNGYKVSSTTGADHKADNWLIIPSDFSGVLQNYNNGVPTANFAGWKLVAGSVYETGASPNGGPIGCNIDAVNAATAGCISGNWGGSPPPPPPSGLIASDSFDYAVPGSLNGQSGGTGFASGWAAVSGQGNPALAAGSLPFSNLAIGGNKLQPATTNQSVRNFASAINAANSTKWVSFRIKQSGGSLPSNHVGFPLYPSANGGGTSIFLGKPSNAANWGVDIGGSQSNVSGTAQLNAFLLYKLVFTSTQVTVSMWVNPSLASESGLGTSHITPLTASHGTQLSSMKVSTGTNSTGYQLDEFRMGSSFADVVPTTMVVYDGFNYTVPGSLNGKNGGVGFGTNAWTAVSGQGNPALAAGSLTYASGPLATVGNKLAPATTNQSVRNFASAINAANSTKWVSFRIKRTVTGTLPTNHVGFPLYPSINGGGTSIFLGKPSNAANWGVDIGGSQSNVSGTAQLDAFLVYKLVFTSTQVTVSMWVNPSLAGESSLGTSHITPLTVSHGGQLSSMKMSTGSNSTNYELDEFRFGPTFADVTPTD